jgi:CRP-like cAMP-binding protein
METAERVFHSDRMAGGSARLTRALTEIAEPCLLSAGEMLFDQGDPGDAVYAVVSGLLEVSAMSPEGRKLTLNTLGPGDIFGEIALFDGGPRTARVQARSEARLSRVRRDRLLEALARDPALTADLLSMAGRHMRGMSEAFEGVTFLPLGARLARVLLRLAERFGEADGTVAFSQAELADQLGATREAVARVIGGWRRSGWIEPSRGRLRLKDRDALAREAGFNGS